MSALNNCTRLLRSMPLIVKTFDGSIVRLCGSRNIHSSGMRYSHFDPNDTSNALHRVKHNGARDGTDNIVTTSFPAKRAEEKARALKIDSISRHIFLCCDQTKLNKGSKTCCSMEEGHAVWEFLKSRTRDLNKEHVDQHIARSKVNCLQVCSEGPIAVVYPEGVWYKKVDVPALEEILHEHLIGGRVVEKYRLRPTPRAADDISTSSKHNT